MRQFFRQGWTLGWAVFIFLIVAFTVMAWADGALATTTSVHVEWRRGVHTYGGQAVTSTGASAASSAAPHFDDSGTSGGIVRITATAGASIVYIAPGSPVATQTNGVYMAQGDPPQEFPVNPGDEVAIIAATDQPTAIAGGGGGSGGAATIADGADSAQGATTDGTCAGDATSGCTLMQRVDRLIARVSTLITTVNSPLQTGGSVAVTSCSGCGGGADSGSSAAVSATPGASSHAAGTSIGGLFSVALARVNGGSGEIERLVWTSTGGNAVAYLVRIWDKNPTSTTCTDGSAFVSNATDDLHLVAQPFLITPAAPSLTTGDTKTYAEQDFAPPASYQNQDGTPGKNIYVCAIASGTITLDDSAAVKLSLLGPQN